MQFDDRVNELADVPSTGFRLVRVIILETVAVLLIGLLVLGIAGELGYYRAGIIAAIAIWVLVSPIIEIATVLRARAAAAPEGQMRDRDVSSGSSASLDFPDEGPSPVHK